MEKNIDNYKKDIMEKIAKTYITYIGSQRESGRKQYLWFRDIRNLSVMHHVNTAIRRAGEHS